MRTSKFFAVRHRPPVVSQALAGLLLIFGLMAGLWCGPVRAATLLPYGTAAGDTALPKSDDGALNVSFVGQGPGGSTPLLTFYDRSRNHIFVCTNGVLSFDSAVQTWSTAPFPNASFAMIAPLWCDADTRETGGGTVWYRLEQDAPDLAQISGIISSQLPTASGFQATFAVIATWDHVGYYAFKTDKLNTFQAVVATNGSQTYVIYLYPADGINWLQSQVTGGGYPLAGFNASATGNNAYHNLPFSGTADLAGLATLTNTSPGEPGQFIFRVDGPVISNVAAAPVTGTVTASSGLTSWTTGAGNWTGDATTWQSGFNAIWNAPARTVSSSNVTANTLQLNSSGFTFSGPASVRFNQLRLTAPSDEVTFAAASVVLPMATDAITQGALRFWDGSVLVADGTGTINGGTLFLRDTARVDVYSANALTDQTALVFDNSSGGSGGKLDLRGIGATVGTINSVTSTSGLITNSSTTAATLNVAGSGSSSMRGQIANGAGVVRLQKSGTGTLTLHANTLYSGSTVVRGGTLAVNGGSLGSTSSVEVQNGTLALVGTTLNAPVSMGKNLGAAALNITSTTLTTTGFNAALEAGTTGNITLTSGTWTNSGEFVLANFGTSSLTINGGSLTTPAMVLGHDGGTATVALNGGVVTTGEIARWSLPTSISFGGGTLRAAADSNALLNGFTTGSAVLNAGGLTLDTNGRTVSIPAEFTGSGGLTKIGAGKLTLTGTSTHTGPTLISAGELQVNGALDSSAVTVTGTAQLSGSGQTGPLTLEGSSTAAPGGAGTAGRLKAAGLAWNGGSMAFDLGADNATSDHLVLTGPLTGSAAAKTFAFTGGTPGVIYDLITFTSTTLTAADFTASGATGVFGMSGNTLRFFVGQPADGGQHWRIKHFGQLEKSGAAADDADPDHDGLANLLEFALVQNPAAAGAAAPAGKINAGYLEFTFLRDDASEALVALKVGVSHDLAQWTNIPVGATSSTSSEGVIITVLENGADPDTITVQVPTAGGTNRFSRVSATSL